jgi:hypothetical protein
VIALGLAVLAVAWCAAPAAAQDELGIKSKKEFTGELRSRFQSLLEGNSKYTPADKDVSRVAAEKLVYQFTWKDTYRNKPGAPEEQRQFLNFMKKAGETPGNQLFMDAFAKDLIECLKTVLAIPMDDTTRQYCVNAALLLPSLARCKHEAVGDFLADIVADPKQHALYRYNAVKGLREFFPVYRVKDGDDLTDKRVQDRRARAIKRVDAVIAYINQKWDLPDNPSKEVLDAVHFQRREGIRTLALAGTPAVEVEKTRPAKVNGPAAVGLLRVLVKGGLTPPASPSERYEAAIGVCSLDGRPFADYQSPLAVALVGQAILDFTEDYLKDYGAVSTKKIPLLPWKVYADRLEQGLRDFHKLAPRETDAQRKAQDQIKSIFELTNKTLFPAIKGSRSIEPPGELRGLVESLGPTDGPVFEGVPATAVKGGKGG